LTRTAPLPDTSQIDPFCGDRQEFRAFMRHFAPLAAALLASFLLAGPAAAQGTVRSQHGDWQMSCDLVPGALDEQCALIQNVTAEDQPNVALSVIVLKTADQEARLLRVLAPLGVLLPHGLGLTIHAELSRRVAFLRRP